MLRRLATVLWGLAHRTDYLMRVEERVTELERSRATVEELVGTLLSEVAALQQRIQGLEARVAALEEGARLERERGRDGRGAA